jgi:hypothetical protein
LRAIVAIVDLAGLSEARMSASRYVASIVVVVLGCGDNKSRPIDAPFPPDARIPALGPGIELGVLPPRTAAPFAHATEVSLAASGDTVMAAYINLGDSDPTTYVLDGEFDKRVGIAVSTDRGGTFAPPVDPQTTTLTFSSDPVIRAGSDGTFWFTTLGVTPGVEMAVARSLDGVAWQTVYAMPADDKEWFALDDVSVWVGCGPDLDRIDWTGSSLGRATSPYSQVTGAYLDGDGAHFGYFAGQGETVVPIVQWDGSSPPAREGALLPVGDVADPENYTSTISMGSLGDGQWIVRTVQRDGMPAIALRIRHLPDEGEDLFISEPGAHAFLPAAIVDEDGRLWVVYYDSSGEHGVLRRTRSVSTEWLEGFEASSVIDPDATPGDRWFPSHEAGTSDPAGRRLREYIDVALTSRRVHVAWTHSPQSPSRVRTTYFDY